MQPLSDIRVLDFTTLLPGPLATLMLAEAGAEVIKIEKPGGEDMRHYPPFVNGESAAFVLLNRGKKSIEIDLKSEGAVNRLRPLIESADVVVEQFRPGVMDRLGLGYKAVSALNPRLVYCAVTGYGQTGPRAGEAGHDLNYVASSGLLELSRGLVAAPVVPPALVADIAGGAQPAFANVLLALLQRHQTGRGSYIDIAMTDATFTFSVFAQAELAAGRPLPQSGEGLLTGGSPRYRLYPTADGQLVAVAALEQKFWDRLCAALEIPAAGRDDRRDPGKAGEAIARAIRAHDADTLRPLLRQADCCATLVEPLSEAMTEPHFQQRGLFDHRVRIGAREAPAAVMPIDTRFRQRAGLRKAPQLGSDNALLAD